MKGYGSCRSFDRRLALLFARVCYVLRVVQSRRQWSWTRDPTRDRGSIVDGDEGLIRSGVPGGLLVRGFMRRHCVGME